MLLAEANFNLLVFHFRLASENEIHRSFAQSTLACGSMVLYVYCVSFFRPGEAKK
jgi:hypothetical protein